MARPPGGAVEKFVARKGPVHRRRSPGDRQARRAGRPSRSQDGDQPRGASCPAAIRFPASADDRAPPGPGHQRLPVARPQPQVAQAVSASLRSGTRREELCRDRRRDTGRRGGRDRHAARKDLEPRGRLADRSRSPRQGGAHPLAQAGRAGRARGDIVHAGDRPHPHLRAAEAARRGSTRRAASATRSPAIRSMATAVARCCSTLCR